MRSAYFAILNFSWYTDRYLISLPIDELHKKSIYCDFMPKMVKVIEVLTLSLLHATISCELASSVGGNSDGDLTPY
jgi:hypothetical protein